VLKVFKVQVVVQDQLELLVLKASKVLQDLEVQVAQPVLQDPQDPLVLKVYKVLQDQVVPQVH
jgi:hypothetical protein